MNQPTQAGSLIAPASMQEILDSARNAHQRGQSQFLTPEEFARECAMALPPHRPEVCDLNCGNGMLIATAAASRTECLALDIASNAHASGSWEGTRRIIGDLTRVAPLLQDVAFRCHLFTLNPPWGLLWERSRLAYLAESDLPAVANAFAAESSATIDSTLATFLLALHHSSYAGEGYLIANAATMERLVFQPGAPASALATHVWARITIAGNPMTGIQGNAWQNTMKVDVLWFARDHTVGPKFQRAVGNPDEWLDAIKSLATHRWRYREGCELRSFHESAGVADWLAVADEWKQRRKAERTDWNLWLDGDGRICTHLSVFDSNATSRRLVQDASALHGLSGRTPMQLVVQRTMRSALTKAAAPDSPWRVEPGLRVAVDTAVREYQAARAPIYPLPAVQRLGYLDEEDAIVCRTDLYHPRLMAAVGARLLGGPPVPMDLSTPLFKAGQRYPLSTWTTTVVRKGVRPNLQGEMEKLEFTGQDLVICIASGDWKIAFVDSRMLADSTDLKNLQGKNAVDVCAPLQLLVEHFEIPEVPDVSTVNPIGFRHHLETLDALEQALFCA